MAYGQLDIDMIAGPSEVLVIADETANAKFVAADLLSQAEHDRLASAVLLTTSQELAEEVDITLANLSILKNNKAKAVRFSTLEAICKALDCQPGDILEYVSDEE